MTTTQFDFITNNDINQVLELEHAGFNEPWSKLDFIKCIKEFKHKAIRHQATKKIVAYMFYIPDDENGAEIISINVSKTYRRQGLGKKLIQALEDEHYDTLYCNVRETNLVGQLFFKYMGFSCQDILKNVYNGSDEPAYFFINK